MQFTTRKPSVLFPNGIQETLGLGQAGLASMDNSIPKAYINYLFSLLIYLIPGILFGQVMEIL